MKAAQEGVVCDVTPSLCQTPVKRKEKKTSLSNPVEPGSVERSPSRSYLDSRKLSPMPFKNTTVKTQKMKIQKKY